MVLVFQSLEIMKVVDDRRFLVVKRTFTEIKGSSATTTKYDTIDKRANVVVSLPLIFKMIFTLMSLVVKLNNK